MSRTLPNGVPQTTIPVKISNDAYVPVTAKVKRGTTISFSKSELRNAHRYGKGRIVWIATNGVRKHMEAPL